MDSLVGKCRPDSGTHFAVIPSENASPAQTEGSRCASLKVTSSGSLGFRSDDAISASATTLPPRARPHDSPALTFRRVLPQFDAKEPDQFQTRRVSL